MKSVPRRTCITRWFADERGSTALSVVIAVALSIALVATGVQWYWINSSSSDIQTVADLGALASADAIAKVSTVVQVLDTVLLSMNVVALTLHAAVVVSGIVVVVGAPVGAGTAGVLFERAVSFDRRFSEVRRQFAEEARAAAELIARGAPYWAMGQATEVISANSSSLSPYSRTTYSGTALPFPFEGEVTLSGFPDEQATLDALESAAQDNGDDALGARDAEQRLAGAKRACWDADVYRSSATLYEAWHPSSSIGDFGSALNAIAQRVPPASLPEPVTSDSSWAASRLASAYADGYAVVGNSVGEAWRRASGATDPSALDVSQVSVRSLLSEAMDTQVYVVAHAEGERKAYHSSPSCDGLSGAASPAASTVLGALVGDTDHPPCSLCLPLHWSAIAAWEAQLAEYVPAWNIEASALLEYRKLESSLREATASMSGRTSELLGALLSELDSYIRGGRLTYRPSGSRGFLCVVVSNSTRKLPTFTMPRLTGANSRVLGRQVAIAGARLSVTDTQSAPSDALSAVALDATPSKTSYLAGAVNAALGQDDGLTVDTNPMWRAALAAVMGSPTALSTWFSSLPWGLGPLLGGFMDEVVDAAGVGKPDLRQLIPTLTDTYAVGDPGAAGAEGSVARSLRAAKNSYGRYAGSSLPELQAALASAAGQVSGDGYSRASSTLWASMMGKALRVPFSSYSLSSVSSGVGWAWSALPTALTR